MLKQLILCCLLAALAVDVSAIIGGRWAELGEAPYHVALKNSTGHYFCNGAILNSRWILTVTSCIKGRSNITVQAGSRFLDGVTETTAQSVRVGKKVYLGKDSPEYAPALLKLNEPLEFNPVLKSIPLSPEKVNEYEKVSFAGWGPTVLFHTGQSNKLKISEKPARTCSYPKSFCPLGPGGNPCIKDSGSAVVMVKDGRKFVVGIVAHQEGCGSEDDWYRAVDISEYFDKIKSVLENDTVDAGVSAEFSPSTPFKKYPYQYAPLDLRIKGCTSSPCVLHIGQLPTVEWDFLIRRNTTSLKPFIYSTTYAYDLSEYNPRDPCKSLKNASCPLSAGQSVTLRFRLPVLASIGKLRTELQICFDDDEDYTVFCFEIDIDIQDRIPIESE